MFMDGLDFWLTNIYGEEEALNESIIDCYSAKYKYNTNNSDAMATLYFRKCHK